MNILVVIYYLRHKAFLLWKSTALSCFFGESLHLDASGRTSKRPWPWILLLPPNLTPVCRPLSILYRPSWRNLICKNLLLLLPSMINCRPDAILFFKQIGTRSSERPRESSYCWNNQRRVMEEALVGSSNMNECMSCWANPTSNKVNNVWQQSGLLMSDLQ